MTGIEKIVEKIREESLNRCEAVIAEAKENAGEILFDERKKAEKEAEKIISEGKNKALKKENAARSAAETI